MDRISAGELKTKLAGSGELRLLDVRTVPEYDAVHVQGARLLSMNRANRKNVEEMFGAGDEPVYVLCKVGGRAGKVCESLAGEGMKNVVLVEGGTDACLEEGLPVVHGQGTSISIERQVRIAVGSLNLLAAVLALTIHPLFVILCAFFGAGLLFAGLTDWCGMGLVLMKMPWNQAKAQRG